VKKKIEILKDRRKYQEIKELLIAHFVYKHSKKVRKNEEEIFKHNLG
jgi:hypothetical protein